MSFVVLNDFAAGPVEIVLNHDENVTLHGDFGGTFTGEVKTSSDREMKRVFEPVDPKEILEKVGNLPVSEWSYKKDPKIRHIGPMAQDFYSIFNLGGDDRFISSVDADGIAFAAIQGLKLENEQLRKRIERLEEALLLLTEEESGER